MLGRRDVRRVYALSERGSVGEAPSAPQGDAENSAPDAPSRAESSRLQALRGRRGRRVRTAVDQERDQRDPHFRRAQRHAKRGAGDQVDEKIRRQGRGGDLLHAEPGAQRGILRRTRRTARGDGCGHDLHQGYGESAPALRRFLARQGAQSEDHRADPSAHAQHDRHRRYDESYGGDGGSRHRRLRALAAGKRHVPASDGVARRDAQGNGARHGARSVRALRDRGAFPQRREATQGRRHPRSEGAERGHEHTALSGARRDAVEPDLPAQAAERRG